MKLIQGVLLMALVMTGSMAADDRHAITFSFDSDVSGQAPKAFEFGRTGSGARGNWIVKAEKDAPSAPNVLIQADADDTDNRFPIAFIGPPLKDLLLSVKCKAVSGRVDQGCGLVFRLKDVDNYYVVRANALEDNVRLYHVVEGRRVQFADWNGAVESGVWHALAVDAQGDNFRIVFDGKQIIDAHDTTFPSAGKYGVWTKADSVTEFDDLTAIPK
jgi:hypothetical protein